MPVHPPTFGLKVTPSGVARLSLAGKVILGGEMLLTYVRCRWLLSRRGLVAALASLRRPLKTSAPPASDLSVVSFHLAGAVRRTFSTLPIDATCLVRSLVLSALLARRGIEAELVIGVKPGDEFAAHAWVEREGRALLPHEGYAQLHTL